MSKKYNICLDIGGSKVLGAVFNAKNKIVCKVKKRSNEFGETSQNLEDVIISVTRELIQKADLKAKDINAIAAGVPGIVDSDSGIIVFSPNLPWRDYNLREVIEKTFKTDFYVGNDVNVGVLGEFRYGAAKGYKNVVGFFVGTGVGGGLVINKKLYTGTGNKAAELGHMVLDEHGPKCNCGQTGCLEAFSSKVGMMKYMNEQIAAGRDTVMKDYINDGPFRSKYLKAALEANDAVAVEAVKRASHYLAIATGSMINAIAPDCIVYGGGVMEACGDYFLKDILAEVDKYCMKSIRETVVIQKSELGDNSLLYGGLAMIKDGEKNKK